MNVVLVGGSLAEVTDRDAISFLWVVLCSIGKHELGFKVHEAGTHLVRSSMAIALFLADVEIVAIILLGRWKNAAFVCHICEQVLKALIRASFYMANQKDFFMALSFPCQTATRRLSATQGTKH